MVDKGNVLVNWVKHRQDVGFNSLELLYHLIRISFYVFKISLISLFFSFFPFFIVVSIQSTWKENNSYVKKKQTNIRQARRNPGQMGA